MLSRFVLDFLMGQLNSSHTRTRNEGEVGPQGYSTSRYKTVLILVGPCTEKTSVMKFKTNGIHEALTLPQSPTRQATRVSLTKACELWQEYNKTRMYL